MLPFLPSLKFFLLSNIPSNYASLFFPPFVIFPRKLFHFPEKKQTMWKTRQRDIHLEAAMAGREAAGNFLRRFGLVILASFPLWFFLNYYNTCGLFGHSSYELVSTSNDFAISIHPTSNSPTIRAVGKYNETDRVLRVEREPFDILERNSTNAMESPVNGAHKVGEDFDRKPVLEGRKKNGKINGENNVDSCNGKYIYIHEIPTKFNDGVLRDCKSLSKWSDMCRGISNAGLGRRVSNSEKAFANTGWFATDQFSLEIIFHNRMKQYRCLTRNSSQASAIFVPFYAGLDVGRYLWGADASTRDSGPLELFNWLRGRPEWEPMGGRDHFMVAGRITWDFRRRTDESSDWGSKLLFLPESNNITTLVIESSPWNNNDFAIPYPTYFHPARDAEVFQWQSRMRRQRRRYLYSFAGAPRPNMKGSIRGQIIEQCRASGRKCKMLSCVPIANRCRNPANVMRMFQASIFCLQPSGDSYTRRSTFDSILAGCIPVFFHPGSAYVQYVWHLPKNYTSYSAFIPEDGVRNRGVSIEKALSRIPRSAVAAMREEIIKLIPRVVYADPRSRLETVGDAFDVAVEGVLERVLKLRSETKDGKNSSFDFPADRSWKYNLDGKLGEHEWDPFFSKPKHANS